MIATSTQGENEIRCFPKLQNNSGYQIAIIDSCNNLIHCGNTRKDGIFRFHVPVCGKYHMIVEGTGSYTPVVAHRWACLSPRGCRTLCFIFDEKPVVTTVSFILTDRHYGGLPIEKGELQLWPDPMTFK